MTDAKYGLLASADLCPKLTYDKLKVVKVLNSIAQEFQVIVQVLDFAQLLFHHILCNTHTHTHLM